MAAVQDDLVNSGMLGDVVHPLLPVHDEILLETKIDVAQEIGQHVAWRFSTVMELSVPLAAEFSVGDTWGEVKS